MTPQDRARQSAEAESSRLVNEVFSSPAPEVLNLHAFLRQRSDSMPCFAENIHSKDLSEEKKQVDDLSSQNHYVATISEDEIIRNCLSLDEIRELPCGKFRNYSPGIPSKVLYVKNLAKDVTEADLVSLFVRYQVEHQPLLFRLMKKGRMKGQAFVTFSDVETSSKALQLLNGYILRGKPVVIQFGHGNTETSYMHSKDANE
ncbi:hypothetical protein KP509_01G021100 [Ceratopteris richardii]|nr:hypothetical protein KP509_01G021100 [Ceratopteris richardii]